MPIGPGLAIGYSMDYLIGRRGRGEGREGARCRTGGGGGRDDWSIQIRRKSMGRI